MSDTPPGNEYSPQYYRTVVAHFEGLDGEPPPGVRVVEPALETRQALRGNLYAIVDLVGENSERAQLAERLLSAIQRTYFTRSGSQSQVLTEAVRQARLRANEFNQGHPEQPLELGVICVGLVQSRLMIAHSGPGVALVSADNRIERYPSDVLSFGLEPRSHQPANWEIYRQEVGERTALFVGTTRWLDMVSVRTIAGTVAHLTVENCGDAASGLLAESHRPDLPGLLLVIERTSRPPQARATSRVPVRPAPKRPPFLSTAAGLPVAVTARPPVSDIPGVVAARPEIEAASPSDLSGLVGDEPSSTDKELFADSNDVLDRSEPENAEPDKADVTAGGASPASSTKAESDSSVLDADAAVYDEMPSEAALITISQTGEAPRRATQPSGSSTMEKVSSSVAAGTAAGLARAKEVLRGIFPERRSPSESGYDSENRATNDGWEADASAVPDDNGAALAPSFYSDVSARVSAALEETSTPFESPQPASGGRARLFITLAVLILLLVPVVVYAVYQQRGQESAITGESYLEIADTYLANAETALGNGDESGAREMYLKTEENLEAAIALLGHTERTDQIAAAIDVGLAEVMQTRYLYQLFDPLLAFPADAEPSRVLIAGDHIFIMDRGRQIVETYEMDALHEFVPDPEPEVIMQEGQRVDNAAIAGPVDMAWQPIVAGYEERPKLVVLDRNNQLFSYDLRVDGVQAIELGMPSALENPTQIETFSARTYLADEGANQIFRYDPGGFGLEPDAWFPEETSPYMSGLLAMVIDGDIWLLNSEGTLVRYNSGEQVPFSLDRGAVRADEPVDMVLGSQIDSSIYIADAAHDRILVFDKQGNYNYQLIASEGEPLKDLRGLFLDEVENKIYILTKNSLYQHPLPN